MPIALPFFIYFALESGRIGCPVHSPIMPIPAKNKPINIARIPVAANSRSKNFLLNTTQLLDACSAHQERRVNQFQPINMHIIPNPMKSTVLPVKRLVHYAAYSYRPWPASRYSHTTLSKPARLEAIAILTCYWTG